MASLQPFGAGTARDQLGRIAAISRQCQLLRIASLRGLAYEELARVPAKAQHLAFRGHELGDAREAKALLPSADAALTDLAEKKQVPLQEIADIETAVRALPAESRNQAEQMVETAESGLDTLRNWLRCLIGQRPRPRTSGPNVPTSPQFGRESRTNSTGLPGCVTRY